MVVDTPNNSFNRSANSVAFIENLRVIVVRRARLIRALYAPERCDMRQTEGICRVACRNQEAV
jgi:hypothetical protein